VLACGVDVPYPVGHAELLDAVAAQGVIVSEWPPGRTVSRLRFLVRNRVIAALATGTLVVEAGERSGAVNTARHARDLGRPLMAVPGPVTSDQSAGCHRIIRDWQGTLVTTAAEVIEHLSPVGATLEPTNAPVVADPAAASPTQPSGSASPTVPIEPAGSASRTGPADPHRPRSERRRRIRPALDLDAMDLETTQVLDAMPGRGGMATTRIAQRAGVAPTTAVRCLAALAASGFIERCDEGWRLSRG
jgi:DNA processing protein